MTSIYTPIADTDATAQSVQSDSFPRGETLHFTHFIHLDESAHQPVLEPEAGDLYSGVGTAAFPAIAGQQLAEHIASPLSAVPADAVADTAEVSSLSHMTNAQGSDTAMSETPEMPAVDLERLGDMFKVRSYGQRPVSKPPTAAPRARPEAVVTLSTPTMQLQSDKSRAYLREAMETAKRSEDGGDHINTSYCAKTHLGGALDVNAHIPFHHPDLGPFASVGGLWYFLGAETQDEVFRTLHSRECRMRGKALKMREVKGFKTILAEATWIKIVGQEKLAEAVRDCTLPFRCYYLLGELALPVRSENEEWYCAVLNAIRTTLQGMQYSADAPQFPDFDFLEAPSMGARRRSRRQS